MKPIEKFKLIESIKAIMEKEGFTLRDVVALTGLSEQNLNRYLTGSALPSGARLDELVDFEMMAPIERAYRYSNGRLAAQPDMPFIRDESVESSTHQLLLELTARVEKLEGLTLKTSFFGKSLTKQG